MAYFLSLIPDNCHLTMQNNNFDEEAKVAIIIIIIIINYLVFQRSTTVDIKLVNC